jgi:Fe2+ transport system protein FeoA
MTSKASLAVRESDPEPASPRSLADLELGGQATIVEISAPGPVRERLLDLGFVPGTLITFVRRAPLGDPCVYALRGVQMCLRGEEAAQISVQPVPSRRA